MGRRDGSRVPALHAHALGLRTQRHASSRFSSKRANGPQPMGRQLALADDALLRQAYHQASAASMQARLSAAGRLDPVQQPSLCSQGQVSQIRCWLDSAGYVAALAFETDSNVTAPAVCAAQGLVADGGLLDEGETLVDIISCR
jgi:hypothetical protein